MIRLAISILWLGVSYYVVVCPIYGLHKYLEEMKNNDNENDV